MTRSYSIRWLNLILFNSVTGLAIGIYNIFDKGILHWQTIIWLIIGIGWGVRYLSFRIHGFIKISTDKIRVNNANIRSYTIQVDEIDSVTRNKTKFIFQLKNGKKITINTKSVRSEQAKELFDDLYSFSEPYLQTE